MDAMNCRIQPYTWQPDEAPGLLLGVGSSIEVLEPREIRDRIVATAEAVTDRYARRERDVPDPRPRPRQPSPPDANA
ncbi:MAG: WYL domain-containing protein [Chloroflexi bacterium]|nr:WYL domain-containing protein [Chloroflexota bacterium]